MVALTVIAVALGAAISAVSGSTRNAAALQQRTYAHWVAMNKLAELQISRQWPDLRESRGEEVLARHNWYWNLQVSATDNEFIRRVDIVVRAEENDDAPLARLTGYLGKL